MHVTITDTCITLGEGAESFELFKKPVFPHFHQNITKRPYIVSYFITGETIWSYLQACTEHLADYCHTDPYFGCYALLFHRLYPLLLSSSQARNVLAYGQPADCGAYKVIQKFMTFLQEGNALTALAQSSFSFMALGEQSCHAFLYCLDTHPSPAAVCSAMRKVRQGGLFLLYTLQDSQPAWLDPLCEKGERDRFGPCTVYAFTVDEALSEFACANSSENVVFSRAEEVLKRVGDLQNLVQSMLTDTALPGDVYSITALILQQTEEILLSIYDYLENDELPILANALKEAALNYYVGVSGQYDVTSYREKLIQSSEIFFSAVTAEFMEES